MARTLSSEDKTLRVKKFRTKQSQNCVVSCGAQVQDVTQVWFPAHTPASSSPTTWRWKVAVRESAPVVPVALWCSWMHCNMCFVRNICNLDSVSFLHFFTLKSFVYIFGARDTWPRSLLCFSEESCFQICCILPPRAPRDALVNCFPEVQVVFSFFFTFRELGLLETLMAFRAIMKNACALMRATR